MSARDEILAAVRRSLHVSGEEAPRRAAVEARLAQAPAGVVPRRGQGEAGERAATFKAEAARAQATLAEVAQAADVPAEVSRFLRESNLAATLRMGEDARLAAMPWSATALDVSRGPSDGHDLNAVSVAFAAVAESGTLALVSGPDNPTTLNFLPDNHVVVVFADDLVGDYESVFVKLRAAYGVGAAPRTVNFVTGPSRSADIEQTLLLGAHGPRRLHIVVVGGASHEAGAAK
ncbi:MAG TPA: lactate utilization protein [Roseiarcus sp.]|nr:lactate utilization protein [Roseiarcus sp.]